MNDNTDRNDPSLPDSIRAAVRDRYGKVALGTAPSTPGSAAPESSACCAPSCCGGSAVDPDIATALGYDPGAEASVPEGSNLGLGCGNPTGIASLQPGETVLDLGSGAGFDAFLAAMRVGETSSGPDHPNPTTPRSSPCC